MKKLVCIVCLLVFLGSFMNVFAEDGFSLRSGIMFGDTIEDIVAKETKLERVNETSNTFKGKIAGYSNAECTFYFTDQKLTDMNYSFSNSCTSRDTTNEVYKTLYQSLNRQYGKPLGNTGGSCYIITGQAISNMSVWVYLLGEFDKCDGDYYDYDEWIVDTDSYHVKIDLISYYYRNSDYEYSYFVDLSYHYFTDDELQDAMNEKRTEQESIDEDL